MPCSLKKEVGNGKHKHRVSETKQTLGKMSSDGEQSRFVHSRSDITRLIPQYSNTPMLIPQYSNTNTPILQY